MRRVRGGTVKFGTAQNFPIAVLPKLAVLVFGRTLPALHS
jgi:hypothetical protein